MTELSGKAKELMRRASRGGGPTERQRRSLKSAVMAAILVPTFAGAMTLKLVVAGFLVAAASTGATVAVLRRAPAPPSNPSPRILAAPPQLPAAPAQVVSAVPAPPAIVPTEPAPVVIVRSDPPPRPAPAPPPRAELEAPRATATPPIEPRSSPPAPSEVRAVSVNRSANLALEMETLDRAVRAVEDERFEEGLLESREFLRHFPGSELVTEARVVEVLALCGLSRPEEARAAVASLPVAAAGNPALRRLQSSCVQLSSP